MRVIGGSLKGKKLSIPLDKSTRPLRDMVRESIFNILDHSSKVPKDINNSKVLDYFLVLVHLELSVYLEELKR